MPDDMLSKKFNMTVEENIFVAKRNIVDYIWKSARLEGIAVTFPETKEIFEGLSVSGIKVDDVIAINNLKRAWEFVFDNIDASVDFRFISQIHKIIGGDSLIINAGFVRTIPVSIGGTSWIPELPIESKIQEELNDLMSIEEPTERSIMLMLYIMRKQMFLDGNKRTAQLAANAEMIKNGCGIISIPIECQLDFTKLLISFYETNNPNVILKFVYDNCISGINFEKTIDNTEKIPLQKQLDDAAVKADAHNKSHGIDAVGSLDEPT